jgi:hypothetical protein
MSSVRTLVGISRSRTHLGLSIPPVPVHVHVILPVNPLPLLDAPVPEPLPDTSPLPALPDRVDEVLTAEVWLDDDDAILTSPPSRN